MAKKREEYDWLNDPFDEKKAAQEAQQARMSTGSKAALGCGCIAIVIAVAALLVVAAVQFIAITA